MGKWVSVEDSLPKQLSVVIVSTKTKGIKIGKYISYKIPTIYGDNREMQFTHWQPLPLAPGTKASRPKSLMYTQYCSMWVAVSKGKSMSSEAKRLKLKPGSISQMIHGAIYTDWLPKIDPEIVKTARAKVEARAKIYRGEG